MGLGMKRTVVAGAITFWVVFRGAVWRLALPLDLGGNEFMRTYIW